MNRKRVCNKKDRAGQARSMCDATHRGQTNAGERRFRNHTTRRALRQLARRAAEIAERCPAPKTRKRFARLAKFLQGGRQ
jgi:hypothetical protein